MTGQRHSPGGEALTDLVLTVFRLNGRLLTAGDRLVADLGLTSARWQVLGAIALSPSLQPVAWLARNMGLNRQGVQRIVNEMRDDGLVELRPNPHHRRAHLVALTKRGEDAFASASRLQTPWANALAKGISAEELAKTRRLLATLCERLDQELGKSREDD
ncbi:MarR family transcriptional regulator [Bradyrhizobium sp. WSM 1738]|uniref:MarR family winged helix-turn-helix transcriptional regulator n=1 Tax=Bradyrhizobium hereditatis TaxID=2821405 RepID=UPI001CE37C3B|nr:helix-turn-helix domain-containing protein [Bradyrhizobium hereditatis]MCA6117553.1 MarR family transcriptional regulator [Bradyrhizobium hereditatis]